jgi:hypothetical protein
MLITPNSLGQNKFFIHTGYKTSTQMLHLRDLFVSRQIWLLWADINVSKYLTIPVNIGDIDNDILDRMEELHGMDIPLMEAEKSQFSFDNRIF